MQAEYLSLLCDSVQKFIRQVEEGSGLAIQVFLDPNLNAGGTTGLGNLAIVINAQNIRLFAPTNGYFPNGAVRHEVLHVQRFHIEKVPKLVLADAEDWDDQFADVLVHLDNALEHMTIVPIELQHNPERLTHWQTLMYGICLQLENIPEYERELAVCLHWTFIKHVIPASRASEMLKMYAEKNNLMETADQFAENLIKLLGNKEKSIKFIFDRFPVIPRHRAALEYISSVKGRFQKPIP